MKEGENKRNKQFQILSALAIVYVVMGHNGVSIGTLDWLFPYDSFHMPLFAFASGYFYVIDQNWGRRDYLVKQFKRLIIPFFVCNFLYASVSFFIYKIYGVEWCYFDRQSMLYSLFQKPFREGNVFFNFNAPSWYILVLFEIKVFNHFIRSVVKNKSIVYIFSLMLAVAAICYSRFNVFNGWQIIVLSRASYLLFWFEMGDFYRNKIEKIFNNVNSRLFVCGCLAVQFLLLSICGRNGLNAYVYNGEFHNSAVLTIIIAANGIVFNILLSKILLGSIGNSTIVGYISTHTFSIMMHHLFFIFLMNLIFFHIHRATGIGTFDEMAFKSDFWYRYLPYGNASYRILYVIGGIAFPLISCYAVERIRCVLTEFKTKDG